VRYALQWRKQLFMTGAVTPFACVPDSGSGGSEVDQSGTDDVVGEVVLSSAGNREQARDDLRDGLPTHRR
jgi:hypothetical protein